ncbi:MAG: hypothetical protein IT552_02485 [Sphingomonadaceae bacterium]|nr:hypothetical protein [Sphingomonadaceae bacterium]
MSDDVKAKSKNQAIGCAVLLGLVLFISLVIALGNGDNSGSDIKFRQMPGVANYAMIVPVGANADDLVTAAKDQCGEQEICRVLGWQNEADMARAFPMTDNEVGSLVFNYGINRTTGYEQALWNCKIFVTKKGDECLSFDP